MENILPGFRRHHKEEEEYDRYDRHGKHAARPGYGPYEYTGQPMGFEHLGSPPKHTEMDARTIAQLGYEGPEGERRKVEAINEQIYHDYETRHPEYRSGQHHPTSHQASHHQSSHHRGAYEYPSRDREYPPRPEYSSSEFPDGVPDGYMLDKHGHLKYVGDSGWDKHNRSHHHHNKSRDSDEEDNGYRGQDERYRRRYAGENPVGEDYAEESRGYRGRYGVERTPPVKVERKVEEDGTVVERIIPVSTGGYARPDPGRIHYGRQESFTDEIVPPVPYRQDSYPGSYAPPYNPAASTYARRPYEGSSSDYVEERDRRY